MCSPYYIIAFLALPEWAQQNNAINSLKLLTFFQELLEKKVEYCNHLLKVAQSLCPGPSEMRGYLLFECVGARLRLAQWHWIRMKITTPIYLEQLLEIKADLTEVAEILGPIRKDSDEGQMGIKAKAELKTLSKLIDEMSEQTKKSYAAATLQSSGNGNKMASRTVLKLLKYQCLLFNSSNLCIHMIKWWICNS